MQHLAHHLKSSRLAPILADLRSPDAEARETAADALDALAREGMTPEEGAEAIEAAATRFPKRRFEIQDTAADLVRAAGRQPHASHVPLVQRYYRRLTPQARAAALDLLARVDDRAGAEGLLAVVEAHAQAGRVPALPTHTLLEHPRHPDALYPALLDYLELPGLCWSIAELCLGWIRLGVLPGAHIAHHASRVLDCYGTRRDLLLAVPGPPGPWASDDGFGRVRREAALLLDLMGYIPTPAVQAELRRALAFRDVRLQAFAIASLLRLGRQVDPEALEAVAASPEMRGWLFDEMERMGELWRYPQAWRTEAAFAEADLVRWLSFPAELGQVPDEIEQMTVVRLPLDDLGYTLRWYVFRFRLAEPHWAARDGWLAGVSGPWLEGAPAQPKALDEALSRFEPWSRRTPEGHVGDLDALARKWRDRLNEATKRSR